MTQLMVVIPTYNGARYLPALMESLLTQVPQERVILVDNASSDGSVEQIWKQYPALTPSICSQNLGFGVACNHGIQLALTAGPRWIFVLNQDLIIEPEAIARAISAAESTPRIGLLALFQMNYTGDAIDPIFRAYLPDAYWDDLLLREPQPVYTVPFVPAAAILLSADCLRELSAFDPLYFMYLEDRDLCHRLIAHHWKVAIAPTARVRHDCGQVRADRKSFRWNLNWYRSRMLYHLKTSPRSIGASLLTGLKYLLPSWSPSESLHWLIAWLRCLPLLPQIARHREHVPAVAPPSSEANR